MPAATVTSKGQVTVPKAVRESLGIEKGDRIVFALQPDGTVRVSAEKPPPPTRILGLLERYRRRRTVSIEAMDAAVRRRAVRRPRERGSR